MAIHDTKYGVHQKMAGLQSQITALEQSHHALKAHLLGELQMYIDEHCHGQNGKDGAPGKDGGTCQCREVKGDKGDPGDVLYIGPEDMRQAVLELRRKLKMQHATFLARLIEEIEANKRPGSSPSARILASHLEVIKRDIERLG